MNLDTTYDNLWKQQYAKYVQGFETSKKKARNLQAFIDHSEGQVRLDFPGSGYINYYIKDLVYYFYHLYNLGSSISEILDKILEIRKEHFYYLKTNKLPDVIIVDLQIPGIDEFKFISAIDSLPYFSD